jgi:hypothetical protein
MSPDEVAFVTIELGSDSYSENLGDQTASRLERARSADLCDKGGFCQLFHLASSRCLESRQAPRLPEDGHEQGPERGTPDRQAEAELLRDQPHCEEADHHAQYGGTDEPQDSCQ